MADPAAAIDAPPPPLDLCSGLSIPPLDDTFFSQQLANGCGPEHGDKYDVALENLDFDFSFDDLCLPSSELDDLFSYTMCDSSQVEDPSSVNHVGGHQGSDSSFDLFSNGLVPSFDQFHGVFKSDCPELRHPFGDGDRCSDGSGVLDSNSTDLDSRPVSGYFAESTPESNGSTGVISGCSVGTTKVLNCASPESQESGNCVSKVSEESQDCSGSLNSSQNIARHSSGKENVDQKINSFASSKSNVNSSLLKRKKESEVNFEPRINKVMKSDATVEKEYDVSELNEDEEKKNARLMRNRESAQLSRQRKKQYVEELEDKVRGMHASIQDLNAKISYFMAENASLRQQMGAAAANGAVPHPQAAQPHFGMYPHPAVMYPWMPTPPPYMMTRHGSQSPLVPIPKWKSQQPTQASKACKNAENKKSERPKTKRVAGVSFLGLLFFIMLFGGLVPMVNQNYGGVRDLLSGDQNYLQDRYYENHHGKVLIVNETEHGKEYRGTGEYSRAGGVSCGQRGSCSGGDTGKDDHIHRSNTSERLVASLYVPRNEKLVKIDGNLVIHSVLASEKTMTLNGKGDGENVIAVHGDLFPGLPVPGVAGPSQLRALGSGSENNDDLKSTANEGHLQQWFREGLSGPMLSSGMCTEVFQFNVATSVSGAIVPTTAPRNISEDRSKNSTHVSKNRNRRILRGHPIPLPGSTHNISKEHDGRANPPQENLKRANLSSSVVVSVLVDPREVNDVEGMSGLKSPSRIFVVVLIDSVKYITYSCMLPFKGASPHLAA